MIGTEILDTQLLQQIDIQVKNSDIEILHGTSSKLEILTDKTKGNWQDYFNLELEGDKMTIQQTTNRPNKGLLKDFKSYKFTICLTLTNPEVMECELSTDLGDIWIQPTLKSLKANCSNGDVDLTGEQTYPMDLYLKLGDLITNFEDYQGMFKVQSYNGEVSYNDKRVFESHGAEEIWEHSFGQEKFPVNIELSNGSMNMEGPDSVKVPEMKWYNGMVPLIDDPASLLM